MKPRVGNRLAQSGTSLRTIRVCVVGAFRVLGPDGDDLTPRGRKACGLLAILALSRDRSRPRATLQDKLWSDRGPEQGSSSLRQALSEIRRSLGAHQDALAANSRMVSLVRDRVEVDIDDLASVLSEGEADPVLLEGLDVRDPEFEHWLRDQRAAFDKDVATARGRVRAGEPGRAMPAAGSAPDRRTSIVLVDGAAARRPWIRLVPPERALTARELHVCRTLSDAVVRGVQDLGAMEVSTVVRDTPGIDLMVDGLAVDPGMAVHLSFRDAQTDRILWAGSQFLPDGGVVPADEMALRTLANQATDIALIQQRRLALAPGNAFVLGFDGIQKMFRVDRSELGEADAMLAAAFDQDPHGIFLAWRAYLRTFYAGEHRVDAGSLKDEAAMLGREAVQADPYNSYVLALVSYVHSFLLDEYHAGHDLAERSLMYNPGNPLGVAYLARAKTYLGDYEEGYRLSRKARGAGRAEPLPLHPGFPRRRLRRVGRALRGGDPPRGDLTQPGAELQGSAAVPLRPVSEDRRPRQRPRRVPQAAAGGARLLAAPDEREFVPDQQPPRGRPAAAAGRRVRLTACRG